jgi:glycosyltransferase involved in cell wall biosynthesis
MSKPELYKELASAALLVYPSIFWETSCMSAIEAMACGTPVITSSYCALKETVPHRQGGMLIKGSPRIPGGGPGEGDWKYDLPYQDRFVSEVVRLIEDHSEWSKLSHGARTWAQHYDYWQIGREWNEKIRSLYAERDHCQSVIACMIVKDAESTLHRTMKSIHEQVDDIVVLVDDSTTDSTAEIAKQYTTEVYPFTWPMSFGDARNFSIDPKYTSGYDWILWIDSDEVLQGGIRRYLRDNCFNSYAIQQVHISPGMPEHRDLPARLFRNGLTPPVRFYGKVHEQPENILNRGVPKTFVLPDVIISHDGYGMHEAVEQRWTRNHEYMAADLQENPWRQISWFCYMRDCVVAVRRMLEEGGGKAAPESMELLNQAIQIYNDHFIDPDNPWHPHAFAEYQRALEILGYPSFAFVLAGSVSGDFPPDLAIQKVRFESMDAFMNFMQRASFRVVEGMKPKQQYPYEE